MTYKPIPLIIQEGMYVELILGHADLKRIDFSGVMPEYELSMQPIAKIFNLNQLMPVGFPAAFSKTAEYMLLTAHPERTEQNRQVSIRRTLDKIIQEIPLTFEKIKTNHVLIQIDSIAVGHSNNSYEINGRAQALVETK